MSDLISREEAIEAVHGIRVKTEGSSDFMYNVGLSSAEQILTEIPSASAEPSGDLISRADAICEVLVNDGIDNIVDRINALPSADRPSGEWIGIEYDGYANGVPVYDVYECSVCGNEIRTEDPPNYCCDCGARMENTK